MEVSDFSEIMTDLGMFSMFGRTWAPQVRMRTTSERTELTDGLMECPHILNEQAPTNFKSDNRRLRIGSLLCFGLERDT